MIDNLRVFVAEATAVLLEDGWHAVDSKLTQIKGQNEGDVVVFAEVSVRPEPIVFVCRLSDIKAVRIIK